MIEKNRIELCLMFVVTISARGFRSSSGWLLLSPLLTSVIPKYLQRDSESCVSFSCISLLLYHVSVVGVLVKCWGEETLCCLMIKFDLLKSGFMSLGYDFTSVYPIA